MTYTVKKSHADKWARDLLLYIQSDSSYRAKKRISLSSRQRVTELLDLMIRIDQTLEMAPAGESGWGENGFKPLHDAIAEMNKRLRFYPAVMHIEYRLDPSVEAFFLDKQSSEFNSVAEGLMVRMIFNLAEHHLISNIRDCICGKRFFASRVDQISCSKQCKQKKYEQTEEFKQKRREQMREVYRLHKQGKVKG
jgi:hypothetical protein